MTRTRTLSVAEMAEKWDIPERTIRNYCSSGKISGAFLEDGSWRIPENVTPPSSIHQKKVLAPTLLDILRRENNLRIHGGIYHKVQIDLTYNSNHIEGSTLTHDQTRYIFETDTILPEGKFKGVNVSDIVETSNHFRCIDYIIDNANRHLTANMLKNLHFILKNGTSDSMNDWFVVGDYKKFPNEVAGFATTPPENVAKEITKLLSWYENRKAHDLDTLLNFHYQLEKIHPFQDGNGRIGRLILFKECLRFNIVPFIITEELKLFYYRGLHEWKNEKGYLRDTCLTAQDQFKKYLEYFRIEY